MVSSLGIRDQQLATSAEMFTDAGWVPFARPAIARNPGIVLGSDTGIESAVAEPFRATLAGPLCQHPDRREDP